jgi:hypothetical protein
MKLAEYYQSTDMETKKSEYFVEIYTVPWYLALTYVFFMKIDPCSKKPWRLWYPLTKLEFKVDAAVFSHSTARIKVTRKWAKENYDWDIDMKWDDEDV